MQSKLNHVVDEDDVTCEVRGTAFLCLGIVGQRWFAMARIALLDGAGFEFEIMTPARAVNGNA